jgi:hypothetical protein
MMGLRQRLEFIKLSIFHVKNYRLIELVNGTYATLSLYVLVLIFISRLTYEECLVPYY